MKANTRRKFLRNVSGFISASALMPLAGHAAVRAEALPAFKADERYWQLVKDQFNVKKGHIMMNAANLCPSPRAVTQAVSEQMERLDQDVSFQSRAVYGEQYEEAVQGLAEYLNADREEIIIIRNTSEGNNIIVNGLELGRGDEVLIWDQNHPSNSDAWKERGRRMGFTVREVMVPEQPESVEDLARPFIEAFSNKTRLVSFSHISNVSGIRMPAELLVKEARSRGILTLIDGAQSFGSVKVDLHKIGCDFYTGSAHKWFLGPRETGVLFVRHEQIERLWPNMISAGYGSYAPQDIHRLTSLGQRNPAGFAGILKALEFHSHIGKENVEARLYEITSTLRRQISERIPQTEWKTPEPDALRSGVLICGIPGKDNDELFQQLYENHQIATASTGGLRFSPHIFNTMEDVERVADALSEVVG